MKKEIETGIPSKGVRAQKMLDFIVQHVSVGKSVYLQTALRTTVIRKRHLSQVRVRNGALEIQCGKRWIDYTFVGKISAQ